MELKRTPIVRLGSVDKHNRTFNFVFDFVQIASVDVYLAVTFTLFRPGGALSSRALWLRQQNLEATSKTASFAVHKDGTMTSYDVGITSLVLHGRYLRLDFWRLFVTC